MQRVRATRSKWAKAVLALAHCAQSPGLARAALANIYNARIVARGSIPSVSMADLVGAVPEVRLVNFIPAHGNVTSLELLCLCSLIRAYEPLQVLELGTFNGNTTLQIAANLRHGARIATLDLPVGAAPVEGNDLHDARLIRDAVREQPRYQLSAYADRVEQFYGNSLEVDFHELTRMPPDFVFVDAGHSEECVRNDTEKSFEVLAPGGCVVWHDYTQDWPDVFNFLNGLARRYSLKHVVGTSLVVYRDTKA